MEIINPFLDVFNPSQDGLCLKELNSEHVCNEDESLIGEFAVCLSCTLRWQLRTLMHCVQTDFCFPKELTE